MDLLAFETLTYLKACGVNFQELSWEQFWTLKEFLKGFVTIHEFERLFPEGPPHLMDRIMTKCVVAKFAPEV